MYTSLKKKPQITEGPCLHYSRMALQQPKVFKGLVEEPCFLKLKEEDQEKDLLLSQSETDDRQLAKELFLFFLVYYAFCFLNGNVHFIKM